MKNYQSFINEVKFNLFESVRDKMTPKSKEDIEKSMRLHFDKTHIGWYEEYLRIKPLVDEAYEYIKSCGFRMISIEPYMFDFNTGKYGFIFDNNPTRNGLNDFKSYKLIYEFIHKRYMLSTYTYDLKSKDYILNIKYYDEIEPWYNRETEKLSLISKLKSRLNELNESV
jgi:hypothetical protein